MTASPDAEWGEVVRIAVTGWPARGVELSEWPPQGVVYVCRRTASEGKYEWMPCFPPIRAVIGSRVEADIVKDS